MNFELNLHSESVQQAGPREPVCVPPDMAVADVLTIMKQHNTGCVLVCCQEQVVGIFTQRDVLRLLATEADLSAPIETVMAADPITLRPEDPVAVAIQRMTAGGYRHLPIVDAENRPTGLLHVRGIIHFLVEHFPQAIYNLPPEPRPVMHEREGA